MDNTVQYEEESEEPADDTQEEKKTEEITSLQQLPDVVMPFL